jgi:hypothetical protein
VVEKLSSKCAHVIKDGFKEKPIMDDPTPPIPCIFLPQQKKIFDHGCENSFRITKNCEADPYKGREILFPSSYATKMSFCGPNTEQPACKVAAKRYSEDRSKKGDSLRIKESNEESVSKAMRPVESTNRSHLHDSSSSSQNWLTDCFGNSTSSESKRNFSKAQVLPTSIDVSMERYA